MPRDFILLRRAMRAEIIQRTIWLCEHLIDPINHRLTITPRELRLQYHRVVLRTQQRLRLIKKPRICATKTVNRLFHVTDQKHFRLVTIALIRRQPVMDDVPLNRVGILKFVE